MKMIDKLKVECWSCYGDGFVVEERSGKKEPYLWDEVQLTCDHCNGKGYEIDKDELEYRLEDIKDMLEGMQVRMRLNSDMIKTCEKALLHELIPKYVYKLEISAKAYARLKQVQTKLEMIK